MSGGRKNKPSTAEDAEEKSNRKSLMVKGKSKDKHKVHRFAQDDKIEIEGR